MIEAGDISYQAHPSFPRDPAAVKGSFTMYSYNRFSQLIINGIAQQMIQDGCSESQIKVVLMSKLIRWGLDAGEDELIEWGKKFARDHNFKDEFKDAGTDA